MWWKRLGTLFLFLFFFTKSLWNAELIPTHGVLGRKPKGFKKNLTPSRVYEFVSDTPKPLNRTTPRPRTLRSPGDLPTTSVIVWTFFLFFVFFFYVLFFRFLISIRVRWKTKKKQKNRQRKTNADRDGSSAFRETVYGKNSRNECNSCTTTPLDKIIKTRTPKGF